MDELEAVVAFVVVELVASVLAVVVPLATFAVDSVPGLIAVVPSSCTEPALVPFEFGLATEPACSSSFERFVRCSVVVLGLSLTDLDRCLACQSHLPRPYLVLSTEKVSSDCRTQLP